MPLIPLVLVPPATLKCKKNINKGSSSSSEERQSESIFFKKSNFFTPINRLIPLVEKWNVEWESIANSSSLASSQFNNSQKIWNFSHPTCM